MSRKDPGYHQREENPHQGASHSFGVPEADRDSSDRERSIETGQDRTGRVQQAGRSQGLSREEAAGLSPLSLMRRMAEDMDRMFRDFGVARGGLGLFPAFGGFDRELSRGRGAREIAAWSPQVETMRRGDKFVVRADLPGVKKEDVNVEIQDNVLSISGERRSESEESRDDSFQTERTYGRFFRAFTLPENVDAGQSDATFKDGVLEIEFASRPSQQNRSTKVPIR